MLRHIFLMSASLIACQTLVSPSALGAGRCNVQDELEEKLTELRDTIKESHFQTNRSLDDYLESLGQQAEAVLKKLKAAQHWIDIGAGNMLQLGQYVDYRMSGWMRRNWKQGEVPQITAINAGKLQNSGRNRIENLTRKDPRFRHEKGYFEFFKEGRLRMADLVTDVFAGFSYTTRMHRFLQSLGRVMKPGADFFAVGTLPRIVGPNGRDLPFKECIEKHCKGFDVVDVQVSKEGLANVHLRRNGEPLEIARLKLVDIFEGTPGFRYYSLPQ